MFSEYLLASRLQQPQPQRAAVLHYCKLPATSSNYSSVKSYSFLIQVSLPSLPRPLSQTPGVSRHSPPLLLKCKISSGLYPASTISHIQNTFPRIIKGYTPATSHASKIFGSKKYLQLAYVMERSVFDVCVSRNRAAQHNLNSRYPDDPSCISNEIIGKLALARPSW